MKWQDINKLFDGVINFFKKRSRSRTIYISGGLLTVLLAIGYLTGVTFENFSEDTIIMCELNEYDTFDCIHPFNITTTYYRIGLRPDNLDFPLGVTWELQES